MAKVPKYSSKNLIFAIFSVLSKETYEVGNEIEVSKFTSKPSCLGSVAVCMRYEHCIDCREAMSLEEQSCVLRPDLTHIKHERSMTRCQRRTGNTRSESE